MLSALTGGIGQIGAQQRIGTSWPALSKYLELMQVGGLIHSVRRGSGMRTIKKPDKLLPDNPNLFHTLHSEVAAEI